MNSKIFLISDESIRLMAVSRAASFDWQFALLVAYEKGCHLYLQFLFIIAVFRFGK